MGSHCPLPARLCLDSEAIHWPGIQGHPWGTFRSMKQDTPIMQSSTKDSVPPGLCIPGGRRKKTLHSAVCTLPRQAPQADDAVSSCPQPGGAGSQRDCSGIAAWRQRTGAPSSVRGRGISSPLIGSRQMIPDASAHCCQVWEWSSHGRAVPAAPEETLRVPVIKGSKRRSPGQL